MSRACHLLATLMLALVLVASAGCSGQGGSTNSGASAASSAPAAAALTDAEMSARLVAADRADGVEDHVVSECTPCGLHMHGSAEHSVTAEGYTFHLCSEACRKTMAADPKAAIARLPPSS
jgi:hypothetical protein